MPAVASLLLLLAQVAVAQGKTTRIVATPSARVIVGGGLFRMGASADDLHLARRLCSDELRGGAP